MIKTRVKNLRDSVISHWLSVVSSRSAFTLIEMLVVVAITAIFATMGFVFLGSYRGSQNLKKTLDELTAAVQATQKRSITQDNGSQWNVRFSNIASLGSQYFTFSGASFSTTTVDRTYGLARGISFSNPFSSSTYDALFAPITGVLPEKKIISMIDGRGDGLVSDLVLSTSGKTTKRNEHGLVAYWHLDEGTSTMINDASGNGNNGTLAIGAGGSQTTSVQAWSNGASGKAGGALNFDGADDYMLGPNSASVKLNTGTVTAWIKTSNAGTAYRGIVVKQSAYGMFLKDNVFMIYDWGAGDRTTGINLADGAWHQVGMVFNVGTTNGTTLYIDGAAVTTTTIVSAAQTVPVVIGAGTAGVSQIFTGLIDEVRIYNRTLSASEILSQYNDLK